MPMAHRQLTMHRLLRGCSLRTVHCRLIKRTVPRAVLTDSEGCMRTYEELMEFIKEENVEFIRLAYFDVFGRQKNISIMAGELERAMRYGVSIDGSAIAGFDAEIRSDLFLRPDPAASSAISYTRMGRPMSTIREGSSKTRCRRRPGPGWTSSSDRRWSSMYSAVMRTGR